MCDHGPLHAIENYDILINFRLKKSFITYIYKYRALMQLKWQSNLSKDNLNGKTVLDRGALPYYEY